MTKRVRDGSITLDDYDEQSLEVVRQVGTGLFVIRIDHLIYIDFCELGVNSAVRDSDQSNSTDCLTHAMVNVGVCEIPRNVLQADTIVVSCGLANFLQ